jgi:hypothetical protein
MRSADSRPPSAHPHRKADLTDPQQVRARGVFGHCLAKIAYARTPGRVRRLTGGQCRASRLSTTYRYLPVDEPECQLVNHVVRVVGTPLTGGIQTLSKSLSAAADEPLVRLPLEVGRPVWGVAGGAPVVRCAGELSRLDRFGEVLLRELADCQASRTRPARTVSSAYRASRWQS